MDYGLADFIEHHAETIIERAIEFAESVDVGPSDHVTLRDHLPEIIQAVVVDLRTPQSRDEEIRKSEGHAPAKAGSPSAAATHAIHRAQSGYSISNLVSEYRALRASVLRLWRDAPEWDAASAPEITRFNEAIDQAIAESVGHYADEVDRWRNIFLGVLGHDLRSPLNAIVLTSQLIAQLTVEDQISTAAARLIRNGERMRELLDKLLVYNRVQLGMGFELEKKEVELAHACREEIELLQASLPATRIHFQSPVSLRGMFDAGRIREALANMVENAQKYGAAGEDISVELRTEGDGVELAVENTGDAIPPEALDLLFQPLRRGGVAGDEAERTSLGLGLFIVDQIAKAHGGTVRAGSVEGKTTFKLHLPRT